jgi:hypothetical protein
VCQLDWHNGTQYKSPSSVAGTSSAYKKGALGYLVGNIVYTVVRIV